MKESEVVLEDVTEEIVARERSSVVVVDVDTPMKIEMDALRKECDELQLGLDSVRTDLGRCEDLKKQLQRRPCIKGKLKKRSLDVKEPSLETGGLTAIRAPEEAGPQSQPDAGDDGGGLEGLAKSMKFDDMVNMEEEAETWSSPESIWAVVLYFGELLPIPATCFLTVLFIANTAMQLLLAQVISEMAAEVDPLLEDLPGLLLWRLSAGHHVSHQDEFTGSTLASRVCEQYVGLTESHSHAIAFEAFSKYLRTEVSESDLPDTGVMEHFDIPIGQFLCSLVLLVWIIHIVVEIQDACKMAIAYTSIPLAARTRWQRSDGRLSIISLGWAKYIALLCFVIVPRCLVAIVLLTVGSEYVVQTASLTELILNALALSFVFELDELFFKLAPPSCRTLIAESDAIRMKSAFKGLSRFAKRKHERIYGWVQMVVAVLILVVWLYYCFTSVKDVVDEIDEADKILCGGNTNLLYTANRATGTVYYSHAHDELEPRSLMDVAGPHEGPVLGLTMSAVLQLTGLRAFDLPTVNNLAPVVTKNWDMPMSLHAPIETVGDMHRESLSGATQRLACDDVDQTIPDRYALYADVVLKNMDGITTLPEPNETDCGVVKDLCLDETVKRHCPVTCRCLDPYYGYFDLAGCPPSCEAIVERDLWVILQGAASINSQTCMDAPKAAAINANMGPYSNSRWWQEFFWQVQVFLAKQGFLTEIPGVTAWPWTAQLQDELHRRTTGRFWLAQGVAIDLVAAANHASSDTLSPCATESFVRMLFDLQLCEETFNGTLSGTLAALCPIQCGYCSVQPAAGAPPHGMVARSWTWWDMVQLQESVFGTSLLQIQWPNIPVLECGQPVLVDSSLLATDWGFLRGPDILFTINATDAAEHHTVDLCGPGTRMDAVLRILEGPWYPDMDLDASILIREVDDFCGPGGIAPATSVTGLNPGIYTVWIDGPAPRGGEVEILHRCTSAPLLWETIDGSCEVVLDASNQSCLRSPSYPGSASPLNGCEVRIFPEAWQYSQHLVTATHYDIDTGSTVQVTSGNNVTISDSAVFRSQGVMPSGNIVWTPSSSPRMQRWELCAQHVNAQLWELQGTPGPCARGFFNGRDCISNNDFGLAGASYRYGHDENCFFQVHADWSSLPGPSSGIVVENFATERGFDLVLVDEGSSTEGYFSGRTDNIAGTVPTEDIRWTSDESAADTGWTLCVDP